jgi:ubiquinol-cytochrome c reductase cytochrome b subunit
VRAFFASRFGLGETVKQIGDSPVLGGASWGRAFAAAFATCFVVAGVTGVGLSFSYSAGTAGAWASVYATENVLAGGWYLRSLHMLAAEGALVTGVLAVLLSAFEGRYRDRRDISFLSLSLVVGTVFAFAITGNALRWDDRGYFGFVVESNVIGAMPFGALQRSLLLGGSQPGNWTLTRLFTLHGTLLPLVAIALSAVWINSGRRASQLGAQNGLPAAPYGSRQALRDSVLSLLSLLVVAALAYSLRAPLEAPANPLAGYDARPEWYFEALFVARAALPAALQGPMAALLPLVLGGLLLALPVLDRDSAAPRKARLPILALLALLGLGAAILTVAGLRKDAANEALQVSRKHEAALTHRALQIAKAEGIPPSGGLAMLRQDPVLRGETLFRDNCASCHQLGDLGPTGKEKPTAPNLSGWGTAAWVRAVLAAPDAPALFGPTAYKGKMPSYVSPPADPEAAKSFTPMPEAEQAAIAAFLEGEAAENPDPNHDPVGAKLVAQRCTTCHLFRGKTDDETNHAPELAGWGSTAWTAAQINNPGTNATYRPAALSKELEGHMPRYDDKLSADDLDLLARFVRSRARRLPIAK